MAQANYISRSPDVRHTVAYYSSGALHSNVNEQSCSAFALRYATGYTGPRPSDPRVRHAYDMHHQVTSCSQDTQIVWSSTEPKTVFVDGGILRLLPDLLGTGSGSWTIMVPRTGSFADVSDRLRNRCIEQINDNYRGSLDLAVDIAEAGQTAKMLKVTDQVTELAKTARKTFGPLKTVGALLLITQYGLKPMLSTIFECALRTQEVVINRIQRYEARAKETVDIKEVQIDSLWGRMTVPCTGTLECRMKMGLDLQTRASNGIASFTSLNPASLAWELLPLSFVADWFLDIGSYLRNLETSLLYGNQFVGGYTSEFTKGTLTIGRHVSTLPNTSSYSDSVYGKVAETRLIRTLLSSYPSTSFPMLGADLGSSRLLSAAALLTVLLKR